MTVSALFFPSGMQTTIGKIQPALAPGRRGCSDEPLRPCRRLRRPLRS
jgi:hypothetical protein